VFSTSAIKQDFSSAANRYDDAALLQRNVRGYLFETAKNYWVNNELILDAGAATAALTREAKQAGLHWNIISLDISPGMCGIARQYSTDVMNADASCMPIAAQTIDGVFSSLMLQWSNTPGQVFSEIQRILKPAGYVIAATLVDGTLAELRQSFAQLDNKPHVSHFFAAHEWLEYAKNAGLSLVNARQKTLVDYYSDMTSLMRSLQNIGANNKDENRHRGLMTPKQFKLLGQSYDQYKTQKGLPATWEVLFMVLRKK